MPIGDNFNEHGEGGEKPLSTISRAWNLIKAASSEARRKAEISASSGIVASAAIEGGDNMGRCYETFALSRGAIFP